MSLLELEQTEASTDKAPDMMHIFFEPEHPRALCGIVTDELWDNATEDIEKVDCIVCHELARTRFGCFV